MKLSQEQFRERMVDYLYGQLEGASLGEFEACLAASAACRAELEAMQRTLALVREGIRARAPDEAPAASVRLSLLAAAQAHAGSFALDRSIAAAAAAPRVKAPQPQESEATGMWSSLRAPWLMPTLGVAAAAALLLFAKEVEPLHSQQNATHDAPPASEEVTGTRAAPIAAAPAKEPSAGLEAESEAEPDNAKPASPPQSVARRASEKAAARQEAAPAKGYAEPPPAWDGLRAKAGESKRDRGRAGPADGVVRAERSDDALEASPAPQQSASVARDKQAGPRGGAPGARRVQEGSGASLGSAGRGVGYAQPPPRVAAAAPAPARVRAPAPAASTAASASPVATEHARGAADELADSNGSVKKKDEPAAPSRDQLWQRARVQTDARRWPDAIASYRELLRRFPEDRAAPSWAAQLATLEKTRAREQKNKDR